MGHPYSQRWASGHQQTSTRQQNARNGPITMESGRHTKKTHNVPCHAIIIVSISLSSLSKIDNGPNSVRKRLEGWNGNKPAPQGMELFEEILFFAGNSEHANE